MNIDLKIIESLCHECRIPLGEPFIDSMLEEYGRRYNGAWRYYAALRDISMYLKPSICLEIGTWQGVSAACLAAGNKEGTVITIDHHSDPGDFENQQVLAMAVANYPNIKYIQGCSTEMVWKQKPGTRFVRDDVMKLLDGRKIDLLFIDGWHGGEYARADFDTYRDLLSDEALIVCDDIYGAEDVTIYGMKKFWEELPGEKYLDPDIHGVYQMGFVKLGGMN